ncbi:hypothetical protein [Rhizorhabdus phycosphaerae]|uniref:hypothetical protein n=1 Tax=Rhizorhabdus phycosphaerae TaxID=2711156 RepID=UPI0013EB5D91|nr:hypothetical protein [Rhizorhabdus phycosphaerae]
MQSDAPRCAAPGCEETALCNAHIIPRGFARRLSRPGGHNLAIRPEGSKPAKQPLGAFDSQILCALCDSKLGVFDQYAIRFCGGLDATGDARTGTIFQHEQFDGDTFTLAVLAILWRASISKREEFTHITLGPYAASATHVLFENAKLTDLRAFQVVLMRYASSTHDARKIIFPIQRIRSGALNAFTLGIGGFMVIAKLDQRSFDPQLRPYIINGATRLVAPHIKFEETAEYSFFREAAAEDRRRGRRQ